MPPSTARANARKSLVRCAVEHVFAQQKGRYGLFIRTIGLARAEAKMTLANLAYNLDRLIFQQRRAASGHLMKSKLVERRPGDGTSKGTLCPGAVRLSRTGEALIRRAPMRWVLAGVQLREVRGSSRSRNQREG
jgi:hypothetical protein